MSKDLKLIGPGRHIKINNEYKLIETPDIIDATLTVNKKTYKLKTNQLTISKNKNNIYVYHMFYYGDNNECSGRWYNTRFSKSSIENNTIIYKMKNYEHDNKLVPAEFNIILSQNAINKLNLIIS